MSRDGRGDGGGSSDADVFAIMLIRKIKEAHSKQVKLGHKATWRHVKYEVQQPPPPPPQQQRQQRQVSQWEQRQRQRRQSSSRQNEADDEGDGVDESEAMESSTASLLIDPTLLVG